jgi:DNA-directed RNA polymerase specialized sigma24 family protein
LHDRRGYRNRCCASPRRNIAAFRGPEATLRELSPQDCEILRLRFALDGRPATTLHEIGKRLGISRERVRQLQNQALQRLRSALGKRFGAQVEECVA